MSLISLNLVNELVELNNSVISEKINHPSQLALKLEEIAASAWEEAKELGCITLDEVEELQHCSQI